jgi:hypothetical protein
MRICRSSPSSGHTRKSTAGWRQRSTGKSCFLLMRRGPQLQCSILTSQRCTVERFSLNPPLGPELPSLQFGAQPSPVVGAKA